MDNRSLDSVEVADILKELNQVFVGLTQEERTQVTDKVRQSCPAPGPAVSTPSPEKPPRAAEWKIPIVCLVPSGRRSQGELFINNLTEVMDKVSKGTLRLDCLAFLEAATPEELEGSAREASRLGAKVLFLLREQEPSLEEEDQLLKKISNAQRMVQLVPLDQLARHFLYVDVTVNMLLARKKLL